MSRLLEVSNNRVSQYRLARSKQLLESLHVSASACRGSSFALDLFGVECFGRIRSLLGGE